VPFTRGRERSRDADSIIKECENLFENGFREVTLLGQNVDSYIWVDENKDETVSFANLLEKVALVSPLLRVRFSTSHPKDINDEVLFVMKKYDNICKYIHLPVQSGSTRILQMMNRTYTREWYISKINRIREVLPGCGLSTDMITGFCTETEEDHEETLSLMKYCEYELAYMYYYSERPGTLAERKYKDDVPEEIKKRRLQEVIALHRIQSLAGMQKEVGKTAKVLIEGNSKKSDMHWAGRSDNNKVVVFAKTNGGLTKGSYADVLITECTAGTLIGRTP
jgi:tRNA-2-methylthio-N6-dimethylallyladenosine synthase